MGSICGGSKKIRKEVTVPKGQMSYHQYIDNLTNTQIQLLKRIYQEMNPIDYASFRKLSPTFTGLEEQVLESLFRIFDVEKTGSVSLSALCSIVSKYTLGSRPAKCEFLYKVFNFIDASVLMGPQLIPLRTYCNGYLKYQGSLERLESCISSFLPLSQEDFTKWALENLEINEAMHLFEIIPSPVTERNTLRGILSEPFVMEEDSAWALISRRWMYAWRQYVNFGERTDDFARLQSMRSKSIIIGARPVEIDNSVLSDIDNPVQLRRNLRQNDDFELLPLEAWKELVKWYGGGPEYIREVNDGELNMYPPVLNIKLKDRNQSINKTVCVSKNETVGNIVKMIGVNNISNYTFYIKTGDFYRLLGHSKTWPGRSR